MRLGADDDCIDSLRMCRSKDRSSKSLKDIGSQMMMVRGTAFTTTPKRAGAVFSVTSPIRSIAVILVQGHPGLGGFHEHHECARHEDVELFLVALECVEAQFCRMAVPCSFAPPNTHRCRHRGVPRDRRAGSGRNGSRSEGAVVIEHFQILMVMAGRIGDTGW